MVEGRDSGPGRQLKKHSADEQDARPFEERVIACRPRLLRVAYVMLGNREDAEDVTQRAMFKAIQSQHLFRGDSGLYTWLYRILVNRYTSASARFLAAASTRRCEVRLTRSGCGAPHARVARSETTSRRG